jgi:YgiT-type zinc finger domain-containing protein
VPRGTGARWRKRQSGEIIENDPGDLPHPKYLILGFLGDMPLHVSLGVDAARSRCYVITVYVPDPDLVEPGFQKEAGFMKCVICQHGRTKPGITTVTLQRGESILIVKGVPADICDDCAEYYLSEAVTEKLLAQVEAALKAGAELEILRYAA